MTTSLILSCSPPHQAKADGLYSASSTSWWALKFSVNTPLAIEPDVEVALACLVEVMQLPDAAPGSAGPAAAALRELATRSCWQLATMHPVGGQLLRQGACYPGRKMDDG